MKISSLAFQVFIASNVIDGKEARELRESRKLTESCISTKADLKYAVANAVPGSIIPLCDNTVHEFNKKDDPNPMTLTADGVAIVCNDVDGLPSQYCILDGGSTIGRKNRILDVQADSFALSGITFQNAESKLPGSAINIVGNGGGVYLIESCSFNNNKVTGSGGAAVEIQTCVGCPRSGELKIEDCTFFGNENTDGKNAYGGALSVGNLVNTSMERCTFTLNKSALETAGADFEQIENLKISDCVFNENYSAVYTGALDVSLCENVEIEQCSFNMNAAGLWAGAINLEDTANVLITNSTFTDNQDQCEDCEEGGSAIGAYLVNSVAVVNSSFIGNESKGWGTICTTEVDQLYVENSIFLSNFAEGGGGIYADNYSETPGSTSTLAVVDCQFSMNVASSDCGGGIETDQLKSVLYENVCFEMNKAPDGGDGCSYDDEKTITFVNTMSNGSEITNGKKGCSDFSFSEKGKCVDFPSGSCPV